jgi:hypothetical protein
MSRHGQKFINAIGWIVPVAIIVAAVVGIWLGLTWCLWWIYSASAVAYLSAPSIPYWPFAGIVFLIQTVCGWLNRGRVIAAK